MTVNKSALIAHVGAPSWDSNACVTYEPTGPSMKSYDGVR